MSKIICDICGTTYQDTAEKCPICGCTQDDALLLGEEILIEDLTEGTPARGGRFTGKKKKEIFDFDEVNADEDDPPAKPHDAYADEEVYDGRPRHSTLAVVLLTIVIALLLLAAGFLFVRYFLPNLGGEETPTTAPQVQETTQETKELTIPCKSLALTSGAAKLEKEGGFFLIHVAPYPENTTDKILYQSADESIATVDASGRVTAVSEGTTVIYITCGSQQIPCEVECVFVKETTVPETTEAVQETTEATEATEAVTETTVPETTEAPTEPEVELKLAQSDFILPPRTGWTLALDCDLDPEDVEWSSEHPHIASVDEKGYVFAEGKGTTVITAKYGDQVATCVVRCKKIG